MNSKIQNAKIKEIRNQIEAALNGSQLDEGYLQWLFSSSSRRQEFGWQVTNVTSLFNQIIGSPDGAIEFIKKYNGRMPRRIAAAVAAIDPGYQQE